MSRQSLGLTPLGVSLEISVVNPSLLFTNSKMSAQPKYTKGEIGVMRIGQLKTELALLNLPVDGGGLKVLRPRLKAALYPNHAGIASTVAVSQPNPRQPLGGLGTANHESASQPNISPAPLIQPSAQVEVA